MQVLSIINFVASIQGLFLSYLLINRRSNSKDYRLLALLVFVMSIAMLGGVLGLSGYYNQFPHLIRIGDPLVLLFGPLLFFYVHFVTTGRLPRFHLWHLLPFIVYLATCVPFYLLSGEEKIAFVNKVFLSKNNNAQAVFIQAMRGIHVLIYVILSFRLVARFEKYIKNNYSDLDKLNLDKAAVLLKLFIAICVFRILVYIVSFVVYLNFIVTSNIISLITSTVIYALAYSVWNRNAIVVVNGSPITVVEPDPPAKSLDLPAKPEEISKSRSTYHLSESQFMSLSERLEELFDRDKIYLENELSVAHLSEKLSVQPYQISELINRKYKEPFFDFVNRNRIQEVKQRLNDPQYSNLSILGIALDCGFNSKSSFNTAFKKFTGLTPSEFKKDSITIQSA
jgi:AraC-like DNA-binding protein